MRPAIFHLNYDTAAITDDVIGDIMGPNEFGERMVVVSREIVDGKTRLGFAIATTHDIQAYVDKHRDLLRSAQSLDPLPSTGQEARA